LSAPAHVSDIYLVLSTILMKGKDSVGAVATAVMRIVVEDAFVQAYVIKPKSISVRKFKNG